MNLFILQMSYSPRNMNSVLDTHLSCPSATGRHPGLISGSETKLSASSTKAHTNAQSHSPAWAATRLPVKLGSDLGEIHRRAGLATIATR